MPKSPARAPETFLPLTPVVFEILVTLASGDRHGYSILTDVRSRAGVTLRPGSLYRALNRLLDDGLIFELEERPSLQRDDERRRYYRLTAEGLAVAKAEAARVQAQLRSARVANSIGR